MSDIVMPVRSTGPADHRRSRPLDRRGAAILTGSIALHALFLAALALRLFEPDRADPPLPQAPPIFIEIEPRPLLEGERARLPSPAPAATAATETRPLTGPTVIVRAPAVTPRDEDEEDETLPSPPAPRLSPGPSGAAATGSPSPPADSGAWQVRPETLGARVGRSMRLGAGGCRIMDGRLNPTEQAICDEDFNAAAGAARPIGPRTLTPGEARREAGFAREGAAALARYEARRAPLRAGVGVSGASPDCPGGNLRGTCAGAYLPERYQNTDYVPYKREGPL